MLSEEGMKTEGLCISVAPVEVIGTGQRQLLAMEGARVKTGGSYCTVPLACPTRLHFLFLPLALTQLKNKFMKKLPRDAEASNVLVGEVDFLESPFIAFVRLQQAVMLGALTEVPVPTR